MFRNMTSATTLNFNTTRDLLFILQDVFHYFSVNNVLQPMSFAFGLPLSSKYTHAMSLGILRLQEQGVTDSFERKWWEYQNQCPKETNAGKNIVCSIITVEATLPPIPRNN